MTSRAISVMKQHGLHEPNLPKKHPPAWMLEAQNAGIDIEYLMGKSFDDMSVGGAARLIAAEKEAVKLARSKPWQAASKDTTTRQRVRAVQAETREKELRRELETLKARLRQADNGQGNWIDERDALLRQLENSEENAEVARLENLKLITKLAELEKHLAFMREHPPQETAEQIAELTGARDQAMEEVAALREHYGHAQVEIQHLNDELTAAEANVVAMREEIGGLERELEKERKDFNVAMDESRRLGYLEGQDSVQPTEVTYLRSLVDRLVGKA